MRHSHMYVHDFTVHVISTHLCRKRNAWSQCWRKRWTGWYTSWPKTRRRGTPKMVLHIKTSNFSA